MKLVLFDCDGTLVDSAGTIHTCMHRAFETHKLTPPSLNETKSIIGLSLGTAISNLIKEDDDHDIPAIVTTYKEHFFDLRQDGKVVEPLYDGIADTLHHLSAQDETILGIVTGKSQRGVRAILEAHNFLDMFYTIRTADECQSKPSPDMVMKCCSDSGIEPDNTYVIGDAIFDAQMSKAAGSTFIGVDWGYASVEDLQKHDANHIVNKASQIIDIVG